MWILCGECSAGPVQSSGAALPSVQPTLGTVSLQPSNSLSTQWCSGGPPRRISASPPPAPHLPAPAQAIPCFRLMQFYSFIEFSHFLFLQKLQNRNKLTESNANLISEEDISRPIYSFEVYFILFLVSSCQSKAIKITTTQLGLGFHCSQPLQAYEAFLG